LNSALCARCIVASVTPTIWMQHLCRARLLG
jgi:hypothetical protein